jgi:Tol biopolymer transport system component
MIKHFNPRNILLIGFGILVFTGLILVIIPTIQTLSDPILDPPNGRAIGMNSTISIGFPESMNEKSVETRISITPNVEVTMHWNGNMLYITPIAAFQPDETIVIQLSSGSTSTKSNVYKSNFKWQFSIQTPVIAFLGQATSSPEIWVIDQKTGESTKITQTGGKITSFVAIPNRKGFLFSIKNNQGGNDIHKVNFDGSNDQIMLGCKKEICGDLAISRDGRLFAFSRNRNPEDQSASKFSYIYTSQFNGSSTIPTPLIPESAIAGILPAFSPDGLLFSFYDPISKGIRVINQSGGNDFLLGTSRIQSGSWSNDGTKIAFVDDVSGHNGSSSDLYIVDTKTNAIDEPFKEKLLDKELGEPDWSPDGRKIIVGVRDSSGPVARQLWLLNLEDGSSIQITNDLSRMNAAPKWRPDGKYVAFQQAQLGQSGLQPYIILWNVDENSFTSFVKDAAMPVWIP